MDFKWWFGAYKLSDGTKVKIKKTQQGGHTYAQVRAPEHDYKYRRYGRTVTVYGWTKSPPGTLSRVIREIEAGTALYRHPVTLQWVSPLTAEQP